MDQHTTSLASVGCGLFLPVAWRWVEERRGESSMQKPVVSPVGVPRTVGSPLLRNYKKQSYIRRTQECLCCTHRGDEREEHGSGTVHNIGPPCLDACHDGQKFGY